MTLQPIWLSPLSEPSWQISWRTLISRAAHPCPPALTPIEPGDTEPGQHRDTELGESPPAGTEPQLLPLQNPDRSTEPMRKTSCNSGHGRGIPQEKFGIPQAPPKGCCSQRSVCRASTGEAGREIHEQQQQLEILECGISCAQQQSHKCWQLEKSRVWN